MRLKCFLVVVCCLLFSISPVAGEEKAPASVPSAVVPSPTYNFPEVTEGVEVLHDFIIKNEGTAQLDIKKVKPG
jgi:hypothetical protein